MTSNSSQVPPFPPQNKEAAPQIYFEGRPLPDNLINFSSPTGKELFKQALNEGYAEGYFNLSSCFSHQMDPAFCGLSSLSIVLNALQVKGAPVWKGPWRWWFDELLNCCTPIEEVKKKGITFAQFACLAKCHCDVTVKRADRTSKEEFIADLKNVCSSSDVYMIISFSRAALKQTGDGHYSPIGAYNSDKNMALVLDTARFKYPSYFASADLLYNAMLPLDKETGLSRGYFLLSYNPSHKTISLCKLSSVENNPVINWTALGKAFCKDIPERLLSEKPNTLEEAAKVVLTDPLIMSLQHILRTDVGNLDEISESGERDVSTIFNDVKTTTLYPIILSVFQKTQQNAPLDDSNEKQVVFATLFMLSAPPMLFKNLEPELTKKLEFYRDRGDMSPTLRHEVERVSGEMKELVMNFCACEIEKKPGTNVFCCNGSK
ncbi:Phytochelatin-domain-containing protein [Gigaspora margarita]|uniref:glutathione gamma-glutamylcysteinyltransferase n=1 Tax=Gigaspora margarita TaxID=4874 RepID=A0A8H4EIL6_GIGMA|nr:Phytochelatin-domain-containing protein [Gigaspora margarita]